MKTIPLTKGQFALVDDADYNWLSKKKWFTRSKTASNTLYVARKVCVSKGKKRMEWMHRLILGLQPGDDRHTDHIDGNGLNNQRSNLRVCTHTENIRNRKLGCNNKAGFKGVWLDGRVRQKQYVAGIKVNNKHISLGCHPTAKKAAQAYDVAAIRYFGAFALTNKMLGLL